MSTDGNGNGATPSGSAARPLNRYFWNPFGKRAESDTMPAPERLEPVELTDEQLTSAGVELDVEGDGGGVHDVVKKTNFWFSREVYALDQEARREAEGWAKSGLPRHDVRQDDPLPVEKALAERCHEVFRQWVERVRTRMQDEIERSGQRVAELVAKFRAATGQLEATLVQVEATRSDLTELRKLAKEQERSFGYEAIVKSPVFFWGFAIAMAVVEFFANFPVFKLLLPMESSQAELLRNQLADAESAGRWAGVSRLVTELAFHPEALFVALVAVIILVLLGKMIGASLRPLVVLRADDHPLAATDVKAHRRQHWTLFLKSLAGAVFVVAFLYWSRALIPQMAERRVADDTQRLAQIDSTFAAQQAEARAQKRSFNSTAILQRRDDAMNDLVHHQDALTYAVGVERNNPSILLLNLALLISAAVVGFANARERVTNARGYDPEILRLEHELARLRTEAVGQRQAAREASGQIQTELSRVHHLLAARPLRDWPGKADRLRRVISLFRSENARLRGLDPSHILAFQAPIPLVLEGTDAEAPFREPLELAQLRRAAAGLDEDLDRLTRALGTPTPAAAPAAPAAA